MQRKATQLPHILWRGFKGPAKEAHFQSSYFIENVGLAPPALAQVTSLAEANTLEQAYLRNRETVFMSSDAMSHAVKKTNTSFWISTSRSLVFAIFWMIQDFRTKTPQTEADDREWIEAFEDKATRCFLIGILPQLLPNGSTVDLPAATMDGHVTKHFVNRNDFPHHLTSTPESWVTTNHDFGTMGDEVDIFGVVPENAYFSLKLSDLIKRGGPFEWLGITSTSIYKLMVHNRRLQAHADWPTVLDGFRHEWMKAKAQAGLVNDNSAAAFTNHLIGSCVHGRFNRKHAPDLLEQAEDHWIKQVIGRGIKHWMSERNAGDKKLPSWPGEVFQG